MRLEQVNDDPELDGEDNQLPYQWSGMEIRERADEAKKPKAHTQRQENNLEDAGPVGELPKADPHKQTQTRSNEQNDPPSRSPPGDHRCQSSSALGGRSGHLREKCSAHENPQRPENVESSADKVQDRKDRHTCRSLHRFASERKCGAA